jgi:hypothetical protein
MSNYNRHAKNPIFIHEGKPYMRIVPSKRLFNSTTVHEVVTRGDFFAVNLQTRQFTVLPNGADEEEFLNAKA